MSEMGLLKNYLYNFGHLFSDRLATTTGERDRIRT